MKNMFSGELNRKTWLQKIIQLKRKFERQWRTYPTCKSTCILYQKGKKVVGYFLTLDTINTYANAYKITNLNVM